MADPDQSISENIIQISEILLSLAPIPGLAAIAISAQTIYRMVKRISFRKKECLTLGDFVYNVVLVIRDHYDPDVAQFGGAISEVTRICAEINKDLDVFASYGKGIGYLKNTEMIEKIADHRKNLTQALSMLSLAQNLSQDVWNRRFDDARQEDHSILLEIMRKQEEMNKTVESLQKLLIQTQASQNRHPYLDGPQPDEQARKQLFTLRHARKDTPVLPVRDLRGEVQKIGNRAAHAGTSYDVWKGLWLGEYFVALKVFRGVTVRQKDLERMERQIDLWRMLKHRNILPLYGVVQLENIPNPPLYFVSPWMKHRDVMSFIKEHPEVNRITILKQVGEGLEYLHSMNILHGGLQGSNVLISQDYTAHLSDFSLSKVIDSGALYTQSNGPSASLRWMSPEAHNAELMTSQADVWSWGMTGLQILSGRIPFYTIKAMGQLVIAIALKGARPQRKDYPSEFINDTIWELFEQCWQIEASKRPRIGDVIEVLNALLGLPPGHRGTDSDVPMTDEPMSADADYPAAF